MNYFDLIREIQSNRKITVQQCKVLAGKAIDEMDEIHEIAVKDLNDFNIEAEKHDKEISTIEGEIKAIQVKRKKEKPYECDKCGCGIMQCMCR